MEPWSRGRHRTVWLAAPVIGIEFHVVLRAVIKNHAADVLSRLETGGKDSTYLEDDLLEITLSSIVRREKIKDDHNGNYGLLCTCQQGGDAVEVISNTIPEKLQLPMQQRGIRLKRKKTFQGWKSFCKHRIHMVNAKPLPRLSNLPPCYIRTTNAALVRQAREESALQKYVPIALRTRKLYVF